MTPDRQQAQEGSHVFMIRCTFLDRSTEQPDMYYRARQTRTYRQVARQLDRLTVRQTTEPHADRQITGLDA